MSDSTHQTAATPSNDDTHAVTETSSFLRTVSLYDWWLIKAENDFQGKRLAVAGVSSRKDEAVRVFVSAPIVKRYDVFSLETVDGVYLIIKGFINEQRTLENGFAPEVLNCGRSRGYITNLDIAENCGQMRLMGRNCSHNAVLETTLNHDVAAAIVVADLDLKPWFQVVVYDGCFGEESKAGIDPGNAVINASLDNVSAICPEILSEGMEKSISTSLVLPEEAPENCEKPLPEDEYNASKEIDGSNFVYGRGSNRRSARLHNIEVSQQKKQPTSRGPPKHQYKERSPVSSALENRDSDTAVPDNASAIRPEISSDGMEKSIPSSSASQEEAPGNCEKPFLEDEHNMSNEMGGVEVAYGSDGNKRSARLQNIKVCQQKKQPASRGSPKHPDKERIPISTALENRDLDTAVPDNVSIICPEILSDGVEEPIRTLASLEEAPGDREKPLLGVEHNTSNEMGGVNVACGSGGHRRSARLHNIKVCLQKQQPYTRGPPKHPDKDQSSTSTALENRDGEGPESPLTPIQSQSKGQSNTLSEQLVKKSASRISRSLSAKTEGCYKRKRVTVKTEVVTPKRKMIKPASSVKSPQEKDASHLNKGSKLKISSVSPESLSLRKSRSGRLLLPPLEFWRNQIPIYNADHEITEIQKGASLVSPCRGSSPSLGRKWSSIPEKQMP